MTMWESMFIENLEDLRLRSYAELLDERQDEELFPTATSEKQSLVEETVLRMYKQNKEPILSRQLHIAMLKKSLSCLSKAYTSLDCSRTWMCYWILHSLQILGERLDDEQYPKIIGFLARCQAPEGGFGGGPGQYPHIASTYAAVQALCTIGTEEAFRVIDREALQRFLMSLRLDDGSFRMHSDGEVDIRGVYCVLAVARLTNVYLPEMFKGTDDWIAKCQTWEGGFGGCPGMEAHGGYTYCGVASLVLLGKTNMCPLMPLIRWIVNKQMRLEGGFQGRTNKVVDGCYSFWQSGSLPLIDAILRKEGKLSNTDYWLFNQQALQEYILLCCQHPDGGLLDKPEKDPDLYHTCYVLSGLSLAQNSPHPWIIGPPRLNAVKVINPVYNLEMSCFSTAMKYFGALSVPD